MMLSSPTPPLILQTIELCIIVAVACEIGGTLYPQANKRNKKQKSRNKKKEAKQEKMLGVIKYEAILRLFLVREISC
jgi:hypothetical protein